MPDGRRREMTDKSSLLRMNMVRRDIAMAGVSDPLVLEAFRTVPREEFVAPGTSLSTAYGNFPLPIGYGQTVSQPFIVAFMLELMGCAPGQRVLEIGTGSGYQTALLAAMGMEVITLEIIHQLAVRARQAVSRVIPDAPVSYLVADGYGGWPFAAPYDGIIVSAAPARIPEELQQQLKKGGGRLVIPAGSWSQQLLVITRDGDDFFLEESLSVRFVPLVRGSRR